MLKSFVRLILLGTLLIGILAACGKDDKKEGGSSEVRISLSGAFALYPMAVRWAEEYQKTHENVKFDISGGGAGKGMTDTLAGAVDIGMVSREVREEEVSQGAYGIAVTKDAVVGVVNADNPVLDEILAQGITSEDVARIWLSDEPITWGELLGIDNDDLINVYTRSDAAGAAEMWSKFGGGVAQEDLFGIAVQADPGLAEAVRQDRLGIGYNNIGFAYNLETGEQIDGLRVLPIDLNGDGVLSEDENVYDTKDAIAQAIAEGVYPSPPARDLYFVTKGKPNAEVVEFIQWVLTEGQAFVTEAGYVLLPEPTIQESLTRVAQE